MVWTNEPPAGWEIDNSKLFGVDEEGVGVTEWKGWALADKDWWTEAAGDQRRSEWLSGKGTVAIADPDEWDDIGGPGAQGRFETYLSTPPISLAETSPNTAVLSFDSSWRPEFDDNYHQSGKLTVSYDGGDPIDLFVWLSDPSAPEFKPEAIDEKVIIPLNNPEGAAEMVLTFGMFDAGNDWWWAIDNIEVSTGAVLSKLVGRRSTVLLEITDTGTSQIDADSLALDIDGQRVEAAVSKEGGVVRIVYNPTPPFVAGSQHTFLIRGLDLSGGPVEFGGDFDVPVPALPEDPLPGAPNEEGAFGVRYVWGGGTINNVDAAVAAIQAVGTGEWEGAFFDTVHSYINHGDGNGLFPEDDPYPEEVVGDDEGLWTDEDFVQYARGTIRVSEDGPYTFGVQTDDGFALRIFGAEFISVTGQGTLDPGNSNAMVHPGTTGNSSTRGTAELKAGDYDIEFLWFERGGGDFGELYVARGAFDGDADTDTWQILGKPEAGETPVFAIVAGPQLRPSIVNLSLTGTEALIDYATPDPDRDHVIEQSLNLVEWTLVEGASPSDIGDGNFRFAVIREASREVYYRVGLLPPPPLFVADFENGADGWTVETAAGDTSWELGTPDAGGLNTAASGTQAWGTDLDADYSAGAVTSLRSPVIDLADAARPELSFNYFIDATAGVEGGQLRFLAEDGNPIFTREEIFTGTSEGWTPFAITLPREIRGRKIVIEFRLLSDGDGHRRIILPLVWISYFNCELV
ncbi:MAG: PA14 domain-containing protein [Verrucomicrobiota bacterium]